MLEHEEILRKHIKITSPTQSSMSIDIILFYKKINVGFKIGDALTTFTASKLRLGYPESIIPEEIPF